MTRKNFRILLVLGWLLAAAGVVLSFMTESSLPPEIQSYLQRMEDAPLAQGEIVLGVVDITFIVFGVVLTIGLFRFKRWAKTLLPMFYALGFVLLPVNGPHVETGWASMMFYLGSFVDGLILALVYFSPLRESFEFDGNV